MVMKTKEKPFRHELKYVIGEPEKALLTERFKHLIQLDKHATMVVIPLEVFTLTTIGIVPMLKKMQVFWFVKNIGFVSTISGPIVSS